MMIWPSKGVNHTNKGTIIGLKQNICRRCWDWDMVWISSGIYHEDMGEQKCDLPTSGFMSFKLRCRHRRFQNRPTEHLEASKIGHLGRFLGSMESQENTDASHQELGDSRTSPSNILKPFQSMTWCWAGWLVAMDESSNTPYIPLQGKVKIPCYMEIPHIFHLFPI